MREFIKRVLSKLLEEEGQENCLNKLLNANGKNTSRSSSEITKWIGGKRGWPQSVRDQLSSSDTYRFILDCMKDKNHLTLFKDTQNELCNRSQQMEAVSLLVRFQEIESVLNEANLEMQKKLVATGIHSFLCFLISNGFLNETIRDSDVQQFFDKQSKMRGNGRIWGYSGSEKITKANIYQAIYKKSCEIYSQLTKDYTPKEMLFPRLSAEVSGCCQLIGDGGSGKSTFLIKRFKEAKDAYEKDSANNPLAIYIPLNQYKGIAVHGETFIKNYIATTYANVASHEFDWNPRNYYVMLDGANESPYASQLGKEIQDLVALGCTILITSRYKLDWNCLKTFSCVKLNDLDDKAIEQVLTANHLPMAEGRLLQTLRRPMWLALYSGLKDIEGINTPGEILREQHSWLVSKVSADLQGEEYAEQYRNALAYVSKLATLTKTIVFNTKDIESKLKAFLPETLPTDAFLRIMVSSGLIKLIGPNPQNGGILYQWSHEHYLDYYQTVYIWNEITTCKGNLPVSISAGLLSIPVLTFLGDLLGEYTQHAVESCLKRFAAGRRGTAAQIACRNLIDVMKIARDRHLENCCFDNLDFCRVSFGNCWISGSTFKRTKFSPAFMSEKSISFLDHMCYLSRHNMLITSRPQNRYISIWDYANAEYIGSVVLGKGIVSMDISPDESKLALAYWDDNITVSVFRIDEILDCLNRDSQTLPYLSFRVFESVEFEDDDEKDFYVGSPRFVAFNSDATMLLCTYGYGNLARWDLNKQKSISPTYCLVPEKDYVPETFSISPSRSSLIIQCKEDNKHSLVVYDIDNDEAEIIYDGYDDIEASTFSPDDCQIICLFSQQGNSENRVLSVFDNPYAIHIDTHVNYKQVKLVATEQYVYFARGYYGESIEKYDLYALARNNPIDIPCNGIRSFNSSELIVLPQQETSNGNLLVMETSSNKTLRTFGARPAKSTKFSLAFAKQQSNIIRISQDGYFDYYDWNNKTLHRDIAFSNMLKSSAGNHSFSRIVGDYYFSVIEGMRLNIWNIVDKTFVQTFTGEFRYIRQIGLTADAKYLVVTKSGSDEIMFGNIKTGCLHVISGDNIWSEQVRFFKGADNAYWVETKDGVNLWDQNLMDSPPISPYPDNWTRAHSAYYVDIPSAKVLCGSYDGHIKIWDLKNECWEFDKKLHVSPVVAVAIDPSLSMIISASRNGVFQMFNYKEKTYSFCWQEEPKAEGDDFARITPISQERSIIQHAYSSSYLFDNLNGVSMDIDVPDPEVAVDYHYVVSKDKSAFAVLDIWGKFYVYRTFSGKLLVKEKLETDWWKSSDISSNGSVVFVANNSGRVLGWDTNTGNQIISWNYSTCEDLYGADFRQAVGLNEYAKQLICENGGII